MIKTALFSALSFGLLLGGCLEQDYTYISLDVTARGLALNESITVTNGGDSSLTIEGIQDPKQETPVQTFSRDYRSDNIDYSVSITQQPVILQGGGSTIASNKICRIINPTGKVVLANRLIRIECGFQIVAGDINNTMTADTGLLISNGLESLPLNPSVSLVTSLDHRIVQDQEANDNPNNEALQITPIETPGTIAFSDLFLAGDIVDLSLVSKNQGCRIEGSDSNSTLRYTYPADLDFIETVQSRPREFDWIASTDLFSTGRLCSDFPVGNGPIAKKYTLDYNPDENPDNLTSLALACFPAPTLNVSCGLPLMISLAGITPEEGDTMQVSATRTDGITSEITRHTLTLSANTTSTTFNLAFNQNDQYEITINFTPGIVPKTCTFTSSGTDTVSINTFTAATTEELICL